MEPMSHYQIFRLRTIFQSWYLPADDIPPEMFQWGYCGFFVSDLMPGYVLKTYPAHRLPERQVYHFLRVEAIVSSVTIHVYRGTEKIETYGPSRSMMPLAWQQANPELLSG